MRRRIRNVGRAALVAGFVFTHASLSANDDPQADSAPPTASAERPAQYYGWLDKFENPSAASPSRPRSTQPRPDGEQAVAATDTPTPTTPDAAVSFDDNAQSVTAPADVVFEERTAEPGEGLGCYYHRAYYSHLPMFKDGVYSLRGSFDVAETYRKPSDEVVSSPNEVTPRENGS